MAKIFRATCAKCLNTYFADNPDSLCPRCETPEALLAEIKELKAQLDDALNEGRREGFVAFAKDIINWPSWMSEAEVQCLGAEAFTNAAEAEANRRWPKETP